MASGDDDPPPSQNETAPAQTDADPAQTDADPAQADADPDGGAHGTALATDGGHPGPAADADPSRTAGTVRHTLVHGLTLARVDVLRTFRNAVDKKSQILAYVVVVGLFGVAAGGGAYLFGREVGLDADLPIDLTVLEAASGGFALLWLFLAVLVGVRTVGTRGSLENDVGVLSVVPTREAVLGTVLGEYALTLSYALPLVLAATIGYAVPTGEWLLVATGLVVAVAAPLSAVAVGFPVGLAVRHVVTRIEFVARHKGPLIVLVFVAYMALIFSDVLGGVVGALFDPLSHAPMAWFADVLLLATPAVDADPLRALAVLGLVPVVAVAGLAAGTRVANVHWFADPVLAGTTHDDTSVDPDTDRHADGWLRRFEDALGGAVGRGTAAVTVLAWKRAVRAPMKLLYAAYPLLFAVGFLGEIVQTGEVPAFAPAGALVFVAWAGAVIFTLNPLGDQGSALPATVLSRLDGRAFVTAHVLAGVLLTVPIGTAVVAALAVLAPLDADLVVAVVLGTPASVLVGSLAAVGIGTAFPRYDAVNITRSTKAIVPSLFAFAAFSVYLLLVLASGGLVYEPAFEPLAAGLLTWLLPFGIGISPETVGTFARVTLVALAIFPLVSVRYAVRRFDAYTLAD